MSIVRYTPGSLRAVVTPEGVAVLAAETPDAVTADVWRQLGAGAGLAGVVDALAAGGPLSAIPAFAVALEEPDGWRVAVRGDLVVTAADDRVDGAGASTWTERSIRSADDLRIGDAAAAEPGLPLRDGVAAVARVDLIRQPAAASPAAPGATGARPAAATEPVQPHSVREVREAAPEEAPAGVAPEPAPAAAAPPAPPAPPAVPADPPAAPGPKRTGRPRAVASAPPPPPPPAPVPDDATPAAGTAALDDDVEATIIRGGAAEAEDDATISLAEARALRAAGQLPPVAPPLAPPPPPVAAGRLRVSSGQVVLLDRTVILGRRPRSTRASGTDLPHLVALDSPQQDISRNHVEVRAEGDTILATDLHTTNGTTLHRRGAEPVRLHPGEATVIVPGDVLDLGDGITVAVEDAP